MWKRAHEEVKRASRKDRLLDTHKKLRMPPFRRTRIWDAAIDVLLFHFVVTNPGILLCAPPSGGCEAGWAGREER